MAHAGDRPHGIEQVAHNRAVHANVLRLSLVPQPGAEEDVSRPKSSKSGQSRGKRVRPLQVRDDGPQAGRTGNGLASKPGHRPAVGQQTVRKVVPHDARCADDQRRSF